MLLYKFDIFHNDNFLITHAQVSLSNLSSSLYTAATNIKDLPPNLVELLKKKNRKEKVTSLEKCFWQRKSLNFAKVTL